MDQQQNSQNIQAPATPTAVPNPPVVPSPTPPNPPPSSPPPQNPSPAPLEPITNKPTSNLSKYIKIFSIVTIYIAAAVLSYFFYTNQRQPKTGSRAATPSPTISLFLPTATATPTQTFASTSATLTPTASSASSFGKLVTPPTPTPKPTAKIPSTPRQTIEITAAANTFTPNQLSAELNQIVTIIITASDKDYDFTIPVFGISKTFPKGTRSFVEFQATSEGVFYFSCQTTCGNNPSATGTLTVK